MIKGKFHLLLSTVVITSLMIPSFVTAGNLKKAYINIAKEGQLAQTSDIPSNYNQIETKLAVTAYDAFGNHGVSNNLKKEGDYSLFNGQNAYITTQSPLLTSGQPHSIHALVKWNGGNGQAYQEIVSWWSSTIPSIPSRTFLGPKLNGEFRYGDDWATTGVFLPEGKWTYVTATYAGSTGERKIYLNGELKATKTTSAQVSYLNNFYIGRQGAGAQEWFNGAMKEVSLFNRVLTADEINKYAKNPLSGNENGLVGYWILK